MKAIKRKNIKECLNTIASGGNLVIAIDIDGTIANSSRIDFSNAHKSPKELMKAKPIGGATSDSEALQNGPQDCFP